MIRIHLGILFLFCIALPFVSGAEWQPIDDIRFRAGYNRATRAPNVLELFTPSGIGLIALQDPCETSTAGQCASVPNADGALLPHDSDVNSPGDTELALRTLASRLKMSTGAIHSALLEGRTKGFEATPLYQRVFDMAEQRSGVKQPRAMVPRIKLAGPKIKRSLTTDWYAHRVDDRFKRCLAAL